MFCRLQTVVNCNCFYVYSELLYSKQALGESPSFKTIQLDCFRSKDGIRPSSIFKELYRWNIKTDIIGGTFKID